MLGLFVSTPAMPPRRACEHPTYLVTSASSTDQAQSKTQLLLSHGTGSKRPREKPVDQRTGSFPPSRAFLAWGLSPRPGLGVHCWSPAAEHSPTSDVSRVVSGWVPGGACVYNWQPWKAPSPWAPCFRPELASLSEGKKIPTRDPKPRLRGWETGRSQCEG